MHKLQLHSDVQVTE